MAERKLPLIDPGDSLFLGDGSDAFGAVREVGFHGHPVLLVNVENAGDFRVPFDAVDKVVDHRVVVRWDALEPSLQEAIRHVMDQEDFPPPGGEVELVGDYPDEDADDSYAPSYAGPPTSRPPGS